MMRHPPRSTFFPYTALSRSASVVLRLYRLILQPVFHWLTLSFTLGARRAAETLSAPKQNRLRRWIGYLLAAGVRSEEHTSELQSQSNLVCRLLLETTKKIWT